MKPEPKFLTICDHPECTRTKTPNTYYCQEHEGVDYREQLAKAEKAVDEAWERNR